MAEPLIVGNWKMNTTPEEAAALARELRGALGDTVGGSMAAVCPPFVSLATVAEILQGSAVQVGAQNVSASPPGAHTGEVSASMLRGLCRFVIVGHSERRAMYGERDADVAAKALAALDSTLRPIVCVGESLEQRDAGDAESTVAGQVRASLEGVSVASGVVMAYEPVWAIGTGRAASPAIAQEMAAVIRATLGEMSGPGTASGTPVLYGGSVNSGNIAAYLAEPDVDGALVGGASLDAAEFVRIVEIAALASG